MQSLAGAPEFSQFIGLGSDAFSKEQIAKLRETVPDDELDILPTGEVYLSQIGYRGRLNDTFGPGAWGMFPMSEPEVKDGTIVQTWALIVDERVVAIAPGEHDYDPGKRWSASWATALESAKSNALMRCCKDIGVAAQCWSRAFTESWRQKYAVRVYRTLRDGEEKDEWRKLDAGPHWNETGIHPGSPNREAWKAQIDEAAKQGRMTPPRKMQRESDDQRGAAPRQQRQPPAQRQAQTPQKTQTKPAVDTASAKSDAPITTGQHGLLKSLLTKNNVEPANVYKWLHEVKKVPADALLVDRDGQKVESGTRIPQRLFDDVLEFIRGGGEWNTPNA